MPTSRVPSDRDGPAIKITDARGKMLESIDVRQMEEALNIDVNFSDDTALELILRIGFHASINLLQFKDGNSIVLKRIEPNVPSKD